VLDIQLGGLTAGSEYDSLVVGANVDLGSSTLDMSLVDPFTLSDGEVFDILSVGGTLSGTFAGSGQDDAVAGYGGLGLFIDYTAGGGNDVALYTGYLMGDVNRDGVVDLFALNDVKNNFGSTLPGPGFGATSVVPELASVLALGLEGLALPRRGSAQVVRLRKR
jgi:hypothetical protein